MTDSSIKSQLTADMKAAMKARDKDRLGVIRLILADFKRIEVDERVDLGDDDERCLLILDKMVKQRRDSIAQFDKAGRDDLSKTEHFELEVIQSYMPAQMTAQEIDAAIADALTQTGAQSVKDMGKVMGVLKPIVQGRVDIGLVSVKIKERLTALSS